MDGKIAIIEAWESEKADIIIDASLTVESVVVSELGFIQRRVASMVAQGRSEDAIISQLIADVDSGGRLFGGMVQKVEAQWAELDAAVQQRNLNARWGVQYNTLMEWIAITDNATCAECLVLHGQVKTYREWSEQGLPTQQPSSCNMGVVPHCRCTVIPATVADKSVKDPIVISGKGGSREELLGKIKAKPGFNQELFDNLKKQYHIK